MPEGVRAGVFGQLLTILVLGDPCSDHCRHQNAGNDIGKTFDFPDAVAKHVMLGPVLLSEELAVCGAREWSGIGELPLLSVCTSVGGICTSRSPASLLGLSIS